MIFSKDKSTGISVRKEYNGFGYKDIRFDIFYGTYMYIGKLNLLLRIGHGQSTSTSRTSSNLFLLDGGIVQYGSLEHRKQIRKSVIEFTSKEEYLRGLEEDSIFQYIGYIEYFYDKYVSEGITEKVISDARERMKGIDDFTGRKIQTFAGFILNDRIREGLKLCILALSADETMNDFQKRFKIRL